MKFSPGGARTWATYYGGTGGDQGRSTAVDPSGNVFLAGVTGSASAISSGGFQNTLAGSSDNFMVKFNSSGSRLWATYYGGPGYDDFPSIAVDAVGNVFLAGYTHPRHARGFQNRMVVEEMPPWSQFLGLVFGGPEHLVAKVRLPSVEVAGMSS